MINSPFDSIPKCSRRLRGPERKPGILRGESREVRRQNAWQDQLPAAPGILSWRYKANAQRAMRASDLRFLKILENTFLFNVVDDPLERANL